MKLFIFAAAVMWVFSFGAATVHAGENRIPDIRPDYAEANFDPSRIAPYTLEDPLTFLDGSKVRNQADWARRRKEILAIFAREVYGQEPPAPEALVIEKIEEKVNLGGSGIRSQYRMYFKADKSGPVIHWLVIRPQHIKKPVPVILFLNYAGNHTLLNDPEVIIPERPAHWPGRYRFLSGRGVLLNPESIYHFPVQTILNCGYAVITACYREVSPDPDISEKHPDFQQHNFARTMVFDLWEKYDARRTDNITALGAWAWALSRGLDLAEKIPGIDAGRSIVTGGSRLGKAALIAAARDERFRICVPVQCGGGGVTLAKRDFGENVATQMRMFTHWYCAAYRKYERNPARLLTFDQHLFLAAIAPRRVLVCGFGAPWFDTEGEFISCKAASPAWEICGKPGLPDVSWPAPYDESAIGKYLGYFRRTGKHGLNACEWVQLLRFAGADL